MTARADLIAHLARQVRREVGEPNPPKRSLGLDLMDIAAFGIGFILFGSVMSWALFCILVGIFLS